MKSLMLAAIVLFTTTASANLAHEAGMEAGPSSERLEVTRECFDELSRLGCGGPKADGAHFKACALDEMERLESTCQELIRKLYQ